MMYDDFRNTNSCCWLLGAGDKRFSSRFADFFREH